jgi:predicted RNA-binding Zn ribbon-like protein
MQTLFKNLLKILCGKTAGNLNVRNLLSFYIRSLTPWQDHGKYARYPFNSMNLLKISLFAISTKLFRKPSVKDKLRYRKINFFYNICIIAAAFFWVKYEPTRIEYRSGLSMRPSQVGTTENERGYFILVASIKVYAINP